MGRKGRQWRLVPKEADDRLAVVMAVLFLLLYLSTMSHWLEEEDSAHFALALRGFDVTDNRPHPPGFPVYVAMAFMLNAFLGSEVQALTSLSAIAGAACIFLVYLLFREMVGRRQALYASILTGITPLFWLDSLKAMSDMPGLAFLIAALIVSYMYMKTGDRKLFYSACALTGFSAGVRVHIILVMLPVLALVAYRKRNAPAENLVGFMLFSAGAAAWLVPLALYTGIPQYVQAATGQMGYRVGNSAISVLGVELSPLLLAQKAYAFVYYFLMGGYGINLWGMGILSAALLVLGVALVALFAKGIRVSDERVLFMAAAVILYIPSIFVLLPPLNPRYLLLLVPMISLAMVKGLERAFGKRFAYGFAVLCLLLLAHSAYLALQAATVPPPLYQLWDYVAENTGSGSVLIAGRFAGSYMAYYGTDVTLMDLAEADCGAIEDMLSGGLGVLTISDELECEGMHENPLSEFTRDQRVHLKRSDIRLYVLGI